MNDKGSVLLIQGLAGIAASLTSAIRSRGYRLEVASSADDALHRLRSRPFDVVLTSPSSTVDQDIALVRRIHRLQPGLKAIVLAPEATSEDAVAALRSHAFACFREPFDPDAIVPIIERALAAEDWRDGISVCSASPDWITLRVSARRLTAERLARFVDLLIPRAPDQRRATLLAAFREILLNAMEHGAGFDPEKAVEVSAIRTGKAFAFHFRDPGTGFSIEDLPHAAISNPAGDPIAHVEHREAAGMRPGGFGILMARALVDEVLYNEKGNEVILIKHMP
jgi:CheY-like chemotaxis protein/anti-sigma regulatory factor (Ser/Thr protein kinase)